MGAGPQGDVQGRRGLYQRAIAMGWCTPPDGAALHPASGPLDMQARQLEAAPFHSSSAPPFRPIGHREDFPCCPPKKGEYTHVQWRQVQGWASLKGL